jgi:hypothetical protein
MEDTKNMRHTFTSRIILGLALTVIVLTLLIAGSAAASAQQPSNFNPQKATIQGGHPAYGNGINRTRFDAQGRYLGPAPVESFPAGLNYVSVPRPQPTEKNVTTPAPQRLAFQNRPLRPEEVANPDAADQSDLLKSSKDPDFILRNFKTMWVDARQAQYFGSDQMKAALGANEDFRKLNIRIVDDPHVADVLLKVSYTFAWDYPFQLKHQNTTMVLVSGKGEGPFSGPLGATDVARQFVNAVKKYRTEKKAPVK